MGDGCLTMRKSADTLGSARTALGRRGRARGCHGSLLFQPTCLPACPPTPIDWQTWPAIGGPPPGPALSPAPSGGRFLRPAGSPLAPVGGGPARRSEGVVVPGPRPVLLALFFPPARRDRSVARPRRPVRPGGHTTAGLVTEAVGKPRVCPPRKGDGALSGKHGFSNPHPPVHICVRKSLALVDRAQ